MTQTEQEQHSAAYWAGYSTRSHLAPLSAQEAFDCQAGTLQRLADNVREGFKEVYTRLDALEARIRGPRAGTRGAAMTTMWTSDTHFSHLRILEYQPNRRYPDVETMNRDLIARWNARVTPMDIVYHLGDFALGDYTLADPVFQQLNGYEKHLVLGNHDRKPERMRAMGWTSVQSELRFTLPDGRQVLMAHHPRSYEDLGKLGVSLQLCGHVHSAWDRARTFVDTSPENAHNHFIRGVRDPEGRVVNVGVDVRGLEPKTLEELLRT